jgi:RNA polymerase-binding transcription factor DksA
MSNHESANQMRSRIQHEKERARDLRTVRRELTDFEAAELYDLEHDDYVEDEETGASGGASAGAGTGVLFFNNEQEEEEEESGNRFAQCLQEDEGPEADVEYITDLAMEDFKKAREAGFSEEEIEELRRWLRHLLSVKP